MCATCGCGQTDSEQGHAGNHAHEHEHTHDHGHAHAHSHTHGHDHPHDHDHAHAHDHPHGHEPAPRDRIVKLEQDILGKNRLLARKNRAWFKERGILTVNLMSGPGAGKTTLLARTLPLLDQPVSVIEGDQATQIDADRLKAVGARVTQINTGAGCHLDAEMVARGLLALDPPENSIVMIENVGNLICPSLFDLGESARVVILSATEGEDKPLKYPHMFRQADLILLNKTDLLPHLDFDAEQAIENARRANPDVPVLRLSASRGDGLDAWLGWLLAGLERATPKGA